MNFKKIIPILALLIISVSSYSQTNPYLSKSTRGSINTLDSAIGPVISGTGLINKTYTDTTAANLMLRFKTYKGALIYTTSDDKFWVSNGVRWVEVGSGGSGIQSIVAGTNITVDNTDPANPIVSASGSGGGNDTTVVKSPCYVLPKSVTGGAYDSLICPIDSLITIRLAGYVDSTTLSDSLNEFIPISGTRVGKPVTGDIEFIYDGGYKKLKSKNPSGGEIYFNLNTEESITEMVASSETQDTIARVQVSGTGIDAGIVNKVTQEGLSYETRLNKFGYLLESSDLSFIGMQGGKLFTGKNDSTYAQMKDISDSAIALRAYADSVGGGGGIQSIQAGNNIIVDNTDPANPIVSATTGSSGGNSINYYLNGSVAGSVATYNQMSRDAVIGTGTDFPITGNGLIAQFITDSLDPSRVEIPSGAWNFELYFSASSAGGTPEFYVDLLKYDGSTFTLIGSSSTTPEVITNGTLTSLYITSVAVPYTVLSVNDRLVVRVYTTNVSGGSTITLHTEDNTLCLITTTFPSGIGSINGLTAATQLMVVDTLGTDFNIDSDSATHTFNLPTASATKRGALDSTDWVTFNNKQNAVTLTTTGTSGAATFNQSTGALNIPNYSTGGGFDDSLFITPNMFTGLGLNDVEKIQRALDTAVSQHKKLVIPYNEERGSKYWMIDSAILIPSNSYIVIQNAVLKLTDSSRDNILRTENVGIGITTPYLNPVENITIVGIGEATLEGADNPRSTGDAGKALTLTPTIGLNNSYGTDVGKAGRSQFGDWRNYGGIFGYATNVLVSGIKLSYMHAYGISFERCRNVNLTNIEINMPGYIASGDTAKGIKNNGAIDFNQSIEDVFIDNVFGISYDDNIALNIINIAPGVDGAGGAGDTRAYHVTGDTSSSAIDSIVNVNISNINSRAYDNSVRILVPSNGCKASNINISNVTNGIGPADEFYTVGTSGATSSVVIIGSNNAVYGGNNPFGQISKIKIDNVKSEFIKYGVWVQTSISESTISNVFKGSTAYASTAPVFADTPAIRFRNTKIINSGNRFVDFTTNTTSSATDTIFKFSASDFSSSSLTSNGIQQWTLSNSGTNIGKIVIAATNNNPGLAFFRGAGLTQRFDITDSTTAFTLKPNPNTSNGGLSILHSNGNVGVGISAPTAKLHVVNSVTGFNPSLLVESTIDPVAGATRFTLKNPQSEMVFNAYGSGAPAGLTNAAGIFQSTANRDFILGTVAGTGVVSLFTNNDFATPALRISSAENVGLNVASPTARLHIAAGTATASTAPLKFTSGTQLTTPEAGVLETSGIELKYSTTTTSSSRGFVEVNRYVATATSLTADVHQSTIDVTATGQTITLPTAVGIQGRQYTIKLTAVGSVTIATTSSQTIDGATTQTLSTQYQSVTVQSTGSNWIII